MTEDSIIFKSVKGNVVEIKNKKMINSILKSVGDKDILKIIDCIFDKSETLIDIKNKTKLPMTSFYRKAGVMIEKGFIFENGRKVLRDGKNIAMYRCMFSAVIITGFYPLKVFVQMNKLVGE